MKEQKCSFATVDVLFITLTLFKNNGALNIILALRKIYTTTFYQIIKKCVKYVVREAQSWLVEKKQYKISMDCLEQNKVQFKSYPGWCNALHLFLASSWTGWSRLRDKNVRKWLNWSLWFEEGIHCSEKWIIYWWSKGSTRICCWFWFFLFQFRLAQPFAA